MYFLKNSFRIVLIVSLFLIFSKNNSYANSVAECYSSNAMLLNKTYNRSDSDKYGENHKLFVIDRKNGEKLILKGQVIKNEKNKFMGVEFKDNNTSFFFPPTKGSRVRYNGKETYFQPSDCFLFYGSYDKVIENGIETGSISYGRKVSNGLFSDNANFKPSFDCKKATAPIEKAICNDPEISFLDKFFHEYINKIKSSAEKLAVGNYLIPMVDSMAADFMLYRDNSFEGKQETFTSEEATKIKKAYILGIMFIPMTISADNGWIYLLGKKLFLSYYMLENQGIKYTKAPKKGFGMENVMREVLGDHYDEIIYNYTAVYDNLNSRLPYLFYYTYYLMENYGMINRTGEFLSIDEAEEK